MCCVLSTERLELRPVTAGDHAWLLAHWTGPDVRRFLFDGATLSGADVSQAIQDSDSSFERAGYGLWLIREPGRDGPGRDGPGRDEPAGAAGLRPLEDLGLEVIYSLAPAAWGKGYATEAARAIVDYALGPLGLAEVLAEVDVGNVASVAVVERLGMTPFDVVSGVLGPMTRYRRAR